MERYFWHCLILTEVVQSGIGQAAPCFVLILMDSENAVIDVILSTVTLRGRYPFAVPFYGNKMFMSISVEKQHDLIASKRYRKFFPKISLPLKAQNNTEPGYLLSWWWRAAKSWFKQVSLKWRPTGHASRSHSVNRHCTLRYSAVSFVWNSSACRAWTAPNVSE